MKGVLYIEENNINTIMCDVSYGFFCGLLIK